MWLLAAVAVCAAASTATAQERAAAPLHACDRLAGNPLDPQRVGRGVPTDEIDANRAIAACQEAVELFPGEPRFQFQLGRAYRSAGRNGDAVRLYRAAAEQGYAGAQNSLGVMYSRGVGVQQDCGRAAYWIGLAAAAGYPAAISNLRVLRCVEVA